MARLLAVLLRLVACARGGWLDVAWLSLGQRLPPAEHDWRRHAAARRPTPTLAVRHVSHTLDTQESLVVAAAALRPMPGYETTPSLSEGVAAPDSVHMPGYVTTLSEAEGDALAPGYELPPSAAVGGALTLGYDTIPLPCGDPCCACCAASNAATSV